MPMTILDGLGRTATIWPMRPVDNEFAIALAGPRDEFTDSAKCICGNHMEATGFKYCNADGTQFEPQPGEWEGLDIDGTYIVCLSCWRVLNNRANSGAGHEWTAAERALFSAEFTRRGAAVQAVPVKVVGRVGDPSKDA